jgi:Bifunctional DNA primase/polymerase, N-terminal
MTSLSYAIALGLPVFPCRNTPENKATDKTPLTKHSFHDASGDPDLIREMFTRCPRALIGVPTGAVSGFDVLDVDPRNGGREWYESNKSKLPATRIHRTRSGGIHLLFKHLTGLRNSTSKIAPGIDVRADGGYVIWWPETGLPVKDYPPEGAPEWPLWLIPSVMNKPVAPQAVYCAAAANKSKQLAGVLRVVAEGTEGERNQRLFWGLCRVREMAAQGKIPLSDGKMLLAEAAYRCGLPPLEIRRTLASGAGR